MSGLGSNSCGPKLIDKYRLNENKINFKLRIKPISKHDSIIDDIIRETIK